MYYVVYGVYRVHKVRKTTKKFWRQTRFLTRTDGRTGVRTKFKHQRVCNNVSNTPCKFHAKRYTNSGVILPTRYKTHINSPPATTSSRRRVYLLNLKDKPAEVTKSLEQDLGYKFMKKYCKILHLVPSYE